MNNMFYRYLLAALVFIYSPAVNVHWDDCHGGDVNRDLSDLESVSHKATA